MTLRDIPSHEQVRISGLFGLLPGLWLVTWFVAAYLASLPYLQIYFGSGCFLANVGT